MRTICGPFLELSTNRCFSVLIKIHICMFIFHTDAVLSKLYLLVCYLFELITKHNVHIYVNFEFIYMYAYTECTLNDD